MSNIPIYPEQLPIPGRSRFGVLEACLGLFATFFLGFAPPVVAGLGCLVAFVHEEYLLLAGLVAVVILTGRIAVHVVSLANESMRFIFPDHFVLSDRIVRGPIQPQSFAVRMGMAMQPLPVLIRVFACVWFLAHFGLGATIAGGMHHWLGNAIANPGTLFVVVFPLVLHAAFILATNVYLVLAVSVFTNKEHVLAAVWRQRFIIDILMTLAFGAVSLL